MTDETAKPFVKNDAGKPRFSLIPPEALTELMAVLEHGANKYGADNWCAGAEWSRYYDAAIRHLIAWWGGESVNDPESGRSHLGHALACIAFLIAYERRHIGQDNRPASGDGEPVSKKRIEQAREKTTRPRQADLEEAVVRQKSINETPRASALDGPEPGSAAAWTPPETPKDWPEIPGFLKREAPQREQTGREILRESLMGEAAHD